MIGDTENVTEDLTKQVLKKSRSRGYFLYSWIKMQMFCI